jgi:hypothetical protein
MAPVLKTVSSIVFASCLFKKFVHHICFDMKSPANKDLNSDQSHRELDRETRSALRPTPDRDPPT